MATLYCQQSQCSVICTVIFGGPGVGTSAVLLWATRRNTREMICTREKNPYIYPDGWQQWLWLAGWFLRSQITKSISWPNAFKPKMFSMTIFKFYIQVKNLPRILDYSWGFGSFQRTRTPWERKESAPIPDQGPWACQTWAWSSHSSAPWDHRCRSCAPCCTLQGSLGAQTAAGGRSCKGRVTLPPGSLQ